MSSRTKHKAPPIRYPDSLTPEALFDKAVANKDCSDKACLHTYSTRNIILTGERAGQLADILPPSVVGREAKTGTWCWQKGWAKIKSLFRRPKSREVMTQPSAVVHDGSQPAYATAEVFWAEPGTWSGRKAHFVVLDISHCRSPAHYLQRVSMDIRFWKVGDAIQSIASAKTLPLSSLKVPDALELSDGAPFVALVGPSAVVGRPVGTHVDPYWDGHFRPGEKFRWCADIRAPQDDTFQGSTEDDTRCVLHIVTYGHWDIPAQREEPVPSFKIGLVVVSDGQPFEMTAHSTSFHHDLPVVYQYLWSPYEPARFNATASRIPEGKTRFGVDFASEEMKARWKELIQWSNPYDTVSGPTHVRATN